MSSVTSERLTMDSQISHTFGIRTPGVPPFEAKTHTVAERLQVRRIHNPVTHVYPWFSKVPRRGTPSGGYHQRRSAAVPGVKTRAFRKTIGSWHIALLQHFLWPNDGPKNGGTTECKILDCIEKDRQTRTQPFVA